MKVTPLSIALRIIAIPSRGSLGCPIWYPPTPMSETFAPVRPSVRYCIAPERVIDASALPAVIERIAPARAANGRNRRPVTRLHPPVPVGFYFWAFPVAARPPVCGELAALSIIIRVPVCGEVSVGLKVTDTLQLFPGFRVFAHFDFSANTGFVTSSISTISAAPFLFLPLFLIVIVSGLLVFPTVTLFPNASELWLIVGFGGGT